MKTGIFVALFVTLVQAQTFPEWGYQTVIGGSITVVCNDTDAMVMAGDMVQWHKPDGNMVMNSEKFELEDQNSVNDFKLTINDVQDGDHGVYICKVYRSGAFFVKVNRAINLHEPEYPELIDKYRYDIMVGGIAAAVLFVCLVGACLIYRYRVLTPEEREKAYLEREWNTNRQMDIERGAAALPVKSMPQNGAGNVNSGFSESTNL